MTTVRSPLPAAIFSPFESQLALMRFFSNPDVAPSYIFTCLSNGAKGRISQVRMLESIELDSNVCESGDISSEVTVSVCPTMVYATAFLRRSQTLMSLSIPPEYSSLPASEKANAVRGKSVSIKSMACFCRGSQI